MVLMPQREGFGLCGTVPNQLAVAAWSDRYGTEADLLIPNQRDIVTNGSRINAYLIPSDLFWSSSSQAAPLPACSGPLWGLRFAHRCPRL